MDDRSPKDISKKTSIIQFRSTSKNKKTKIKKTVSFKENDTTNLKNSLGNTKLFYRSNTFEKKHEVKSILKIKRQMSYKSTSSSVTGGSNSNFNVKKLTRRVVFRSPLSEIKEVSSIAKYHKEDFNHHQKEDKVKTECSCACMIF